ncbi:ketosamine-3-kinase-like [Ambystoma mexicanum]|uniref:ketosamine-3-kinase-like n=1 Tax=Ambystoma mexicanum TaxID=8296 RepID=UPI0037E80068
MLAPPCLSTAIKTAPHQEEMEMLLRRELDTALLEETGHFGRGWISHGKTYNTDAGRVFVKMNHRPEARRMFLGEMASLEAILQTNTVRVPKPMKVINLQDKGSGLAMEHLEMTDIIQSAKLGEQIADLHLHNQKLLEKMKKDGNHIGKGAGQSDLQVVEKFGFHTVTCCGFIPQVNDWQSDWVAFFARQRIQPQMELVEERSGDREARELWAHLQLKVSEMFRGTRIVPALLHGDLFGGNIAEDLSGPCVFDPASYFGHSECDLAISGILGGLDSSFSTTYHSKIPKSKGFERRQKLYQLFHTLNQWNHFGTKYRDSSVAIMRNLLH